MLRTAQNLIKYCYNGAPLTTYAKNYPLQVQPRKLKTQFKEGDKPEYIQGALIKFDEDYKPSRVMYTSTFLVSFCVIMIYFSIRYEHIRDKKGITTHQYYSN